MSKLICLVAGAACLASCATEPANYEVAKDRTYDAPKDVIWERAVGYFASQNISIKTIEKASGIIAADRLYTGNRTGAELIGYADCGASILELPVGGRADLNVFVRSLPDGKTNVSVNTRYSETRRFGNNPPTDVSCNSTGKLETQILDQLGQGG